MIIETRINIVLDENQEDYDKGITKELIPFPTDVVIDTDKGLFFWKDNDGLTVLDMNGGSISLTEKFEDFKKKYLGQ